MRTKRPYERKVRSPEYVLSPGELAAVVSMAKRRASKVLRGRVRDQSFNKGQTVKNNAVGIAGEVCWARYLCVPWYQNSSALGGDGHRIADLQDRTGAWVEVKTSRNPRFVRLQTKEQGRTWGYLACSWWNSDKRTLRLLGIAPQAFALASAEEKDVESYGKKRRVLQLETSRLPGAHTVFANYGSTHHPAGGEGLHCPWCIVGPWLCKNDRCEELACRRQIAINEAASKEK